MKQEPAGDEPVRLPHSARHARAPMGEPHPGSSLPIRSAERRRWAGELTGSDVTGLVMHGAGGVGKSVLAVQIAARVGDLEPVRATTVLSGEVSADAFLSALAAALRRHPMAAVRGDSRAMALDTADRTDLPWVHRLALLLVHVLRRVPALVVLDDFDENLSPESGQWTVRDPALAGLLANWAGQPHLGRVLITCRHRFALPEPSGPPGPSLVFRHLGPLSRSGAVDLARSMPALRHLGEQELDRTWRLLGGHPRAMEYLDALLSAGNLRFTDADRQLTGAIRARAGQPLPPTGPAAPTELSPAAAEAVAAAAGDLLLGELFGRLGPEAQGLLIRVSVYRAPVGRNVLLLPVGQYSQAELTGLVADCRATGLLATDASHQPASVFVHRWTARELHRRLAEAGRRDEVTDAHRRAAEYWRWRISAWPQDHHAALEASYHLLQVSRRSVEDQPEAAHRAGARRRFRLAALSRLRAAAPGRPRAPDRLRAAAPDLLGAPVPERLRATAPARLRKTAPARLPRAASDRLPRAAPDRPRKAAPDRLHGPSPGRSRPAIPDRLRSAGRVRVAGLTAAAMAVTAVLAAEGAGAFSAAAPLPPAQPRTGASASAGQAAAVRAAAAAWLAQQLSGDAIVACDPAMCALLQAHGVAAGNLLVLRPSATDPLGSDVVVATAAVRSQFGARLASVYAPVVMASFGSGALRIDVRAVAPDGAAAYRAALTSDLAARRQAGGQLLANRWLTVSPAARRELAGGQVDSRLLITLAALASAGPVRVVAFGSGGPGASPDGSVGGSVGGSAGGSVGASAGVPLRSAELAVPGDSGELRARLAFVRAQRPPYLADHAAIVRGAGGSPVLSIEFGAPSPLGLLQLPPTRLLNVA